MLIIFIRTFLLYIVIIVSLRLMGKRQIGELQPSELVITILISNMAALPIQDVSIPMLSGAVPILTLVGFEIIISCLSLKSRGFRGLVSGHPVIVIRNGQIDQNQLERLRFSIDDLMEGLRTQSIFDLQDVQYAIVETNGKISVLKRFAAQEVVVNMTDIKGEDPSPPVVVVSDGKLVPKALAEYQLKPDWVEKTLKKANQKMKDVFLMTVDAQKNFYIVPKASIPASEAST